MVILVLWAMVVEVVVAMVILVMVAMVILVLVAMVVVEVVLAAIARVVIVAFIHSFIHSQTIHSFISFRIKECCTCTYKSSASVICSSASEKLMACSAVETENIKLILMIN